MPRFIDWIRNGSTKDTAPINRYEGFTSNGAVVLRDRRGTSKAEIPDIDTKFEQWVAESGGIRTAGLFNANAKLSIQSLPACPLVRALLCAPVRACYEPPAARGGRYFTKLRFPLEFLRRCREASRRREANYGAGIGFDHATLAQRSAHF